MTLPCHYYAADRFDIHHPKTISEFPSVLLQSESLLLISRRMKTDIHDRLTHFEINTVGNLEMVYNFIFQ